MAARLAQAGTQSLSLGEDERQEWLSQKQEVREAPERLAAEQADMETNIKDLSARADGQVVEVEGVTYQLLSFVQIFVRSNAIAEHVLKFIDTVSLMEMATAMSDLFAKNIETQFRDNRVNLARPANKKALFSFQLEVPTVLGGQPKQLAAESRKLLAYKTYAAFHSTGSMDTGGVNHLKQALEQRVPALMREIRQTLVLSSDARNLALSLMTDAKSFLDNLFTFMDQLVQAYGADTKLSEERRWELVQNIVRIFFSVITKPRRACGEVTVTEALTPERAPKFLWTTLQAHKAQKEFLRHNFHNHPEVGPMLTHFLLDVVCFQDEVKTIAANANQALTESQQCKQKIDMLESQYKNVQSRMPAKKGKKDGQTKNK